MRKYTTKEGIEFEITEGDLSDEMFNNLMGEESLAYDTETNGLIPRRDRICAVQLMSENGYGAIVQFPDKQAQKLDTPTKLVRLFRSDIEFIMHYANFDIKMTYGTFGYLIENTFCTKVASKIACTYQPRHSLKDVLRHVLDVDISKAQQTSNWASKELTDEQLDYMTQDVIHLHALKGALVAKADSEIRGAQMHWGQQAARYNAYLEVEGWDPSLYTYVSR